MTIQQMKKKPHLILPHNLIPKDSKKQTKKLLINIILNIKMVLVKDVFFIY